MILLSTPLFSHWSIHLSRKPREGKMQILINRAYHADQPPFCRILRKVPVNKYHLDYTDQRVLNDLHRGPGFLRWSYDSAPRPLSSPLCRQQVISLSQSVCRRSSLRREEVGRRWEWSKIIRPQQSLALYKSFNTL